MSAALHKRLARLEGLTLGGIGEGDVPTSAELWRWRLVQAADDARASRSDLL